VLLAITADQKAWSDALGAEIDQAELRRSAEVIDRLIAGIRASLPGDREPSLGWAARERDARSRLKLRRRHKALSARAGHRGRHRHGRARQDGHHDNVETDLRLTAWVSSSPIHCLDAMCRVAVQLGLPEAGQLIEGLEALSARTGMRELLARAYRHRDSMGDRTAVEALRVLGAEIENPALLVTDAGE
jgi:hypothetical protein